MYWIFLQGFNPVFDETFEFHINLPDLALVRFVVQDDDFIGDGFIGQYTIALNCIQPGNLNFKDASFFFCSNSLLTALCLYCNNRESFARTWKDSLWVLELR